jgi:hypothetical protein
VFILARSSSQSSLQQGSDDTIQLKKLGKELILPRPFSPETESLSRGLKVKDIRHEEEGGEEEGIEEIIIIVGDERIDDEDDEEEDDVDEGEEEIREMRERRVKMIRQIDDNDPSLSEIWIGTDEDEYEVMPSDRNWKGFGEIMGRNTHINEVTFSLNTQHFAYGDKSGSQLLSRACHESLMHSEASF